MRNSKIIKRVLLSLFLIGVFTTVIFIKIPNEIFTSVTLNTECKIPTLRRMVLNNDVDKNKLLDNNSRIKLNDLSIPLLMVQSSLQPIYISFATGKTPDQKTSLILSFSVDSGKNPFKKLQTWIKLNQIKKEIIASVDKLYKYCENTANTYGSEIVQTTLKDSTILVIRGTSQSFPAISEIYSKIELLENYAKKQKAKPTNNPMLNIKQENDKQYTYSVGLPIDKYLPDSDQISTKRMLSGGKFLTATVEGGFHKVRSSEIKLQQYLLDYSYSSPAIPFQSLVTNRMIEQDTAKWITKLYYPIY